MTVAEAIIYLQVELNKNLTNRNLSVRDAQAILLLRKAQSDYVRNIIFNERNSDNLEIVNILLENETLQLSNKKSDMYMFKFPDNVIRVENAKIYANSGSCEVELEGVDVKNKNKVILGNNQNTKADITFRFAPYTIGSNSVRVEADFGIGKVNIDYYREPALIDVAGYLNADNTPSRNVEFEFSDGVVMKIVDLAVRNFLTYNQIQT
jgi:hypothetical protein